MSDEKEALSAALESLIPPQALRVLHKAIIRDQSDNTVGVETPGVGAPSATVKPAPVFFGLPGFSATFRPDASPETSIGFHAGAEDGAFAALFPFFRAGSQLPVFEISYGGGIKPIARVDDTTNSGRLLFVQAPVGPGGVPSTLTIVYVDPLGNPTPILTFPIPGPAIMFAQDPMAPSPLVAVLDLLGRITSGREEFKA